MLCYVDDALVPGITRRSKARDWQYFDPEGKRITDRDEIDRLNAIALPPAYKHAWFSPDPNGHILAVGYDDRGRKQYRYHPEFRAQQEMVKYDLCADFGRTLPKLRKRVEQDLSCRTLARDTVIAAVVRLLDCERIRVGNEAYAKSNNSFGATTLRRRHLKTFGRSVKVHYRGKGGIERNLTITDRGLLRIVKHAQDLPGQHLFKYLDDEGNAVPVTSTDVNVYIKDAMDADFTAKHFRTWGASTIAFEQLCNAGKKGITLKDLLKPVADALGNTPAISRKSYVHPALIETVKDNPRNPLDGLQCPPKTKYLSRAERGLILFLEDWADRQKINTEAA